ncbi:Copper amine oxidase, N2/N3-terminal [Corchorus capsularis]|uniref:Copper amine oxidase, N2/N3-terminal n=1 Tax=Corchorus capsularis TaxID=210143 RepID=A0A1R3I8F0_COCAP|nr:Copper amine oxidase, N2/N3-terminal [Corchorus capsularis]
MAAPLLLKGLPMLRLRLQQYNRLTAGLFSAPRRSWCAAADSGGHEEEVSTAEKISTVLSVKEPPNFDKWDNPDYRKWKDKEDEILQDIEPTILLAKEILHSTRYLDGERLTVADEKVVLEKLLSHHPHSEDKIGCGLDFIMVSPSVGVFQCFLELL